MNKQEIENQIKKLNQELIDLENKEKSSDCIKNLSDYSDKEKIEKFDKIYQYLIDILESKKTEDYNDEDDATYLYEYMFDEIIAKNNDAFWKYHNSL